MFANGNVVQNAPLIDVTAEIANLSEQGFSPIEIYERLEFGYAQRGMEMPKDLGFATIERIAKQVGGPMKETTGSIGPLVGPSQPGGDIDNPLATGIYNVIPQTAPDRLSPADASLDPRLGSYAQSGQTLNPAQQPITDLSPDLEQLMNQQNENQDDLPQLEQKELKPYEIRLSDGRIQDFRQGIQDIQEGKGMGLRLYRIYNSPDIEKGADVEQALQEFVDKDQPGVLRMAGGQPEDFGSAISSAGRKIINIGREGLEKTVPSIFDFFGGAEAGESAKDFLEAEFMPEGYGERGGLSKEQIDNVVIAASGGRGSISDDIDALTTDDTELQPSTPETFTPEVPLTGDNFIPETGEGAGADGSQETTGDAETGDSIATEVAKTVASGEGASKDPSAPSIYSSNKAPETNFAQFTQSPDFIRFVRNIGKGLVTTGEMGKGIALGSAAAAEEKSADEKSEAEAYTKFLKDQAAEKQKFKDPDYLKMVKNAKIEAATQYRTYQEAESTRALADSVIQFLDDGNITDFSSRLGVAEEKILSLAGLGPEDIKDQTPRARAQTALTILKQKNIKAILNESSRTISNVDREIADKIAGSLEDFDLTTEGALKQKLAESRRSAIETKNEAVRKGRAEYDLLFESGDHLSLDKDITSFITGRLSSIQQNKNKGFGYDPSIIFIDAS